MAQRGLACFDFDWSLIDTDSDRWVMEHLSPALRDRLDSREMQWTDLQNDCLREYHQGGGSGDKIKSALRKVPMDSHMIQACQLLHDNGWTLAIVSDANTVYIEEILEHYKVRSLFSAIISNPGHWDDADRLHIQRLIPADSPPHGCPTGLCSLNICKGQEVDKILRGLCSQGEIGEASSTATTTKMIYVGDGQNDYCPALRMSDSQDVFFVRKGRSLEKFLAIKRDQDPAVLEAIKARTVYWKQAGDILNELQGNQGFVRLKK